MARKGKKRSLKAAVAEDRAVYGMDMPMRYRRAGGTHRKRRAVRMAKR